MRVVDAQVHVWTGSSPERPWPAWGARVAHRATPVGVARTLRVLDDAGVAHAVLVPPSWEGDRNDLAWAAAARHPDRFAVMGRVDVTDPNVPRLLARWRERPGSLGIRITLHRAPARTAFLAGMLEPLWTAASVAGVPVMVYPPGLCDQLADVAERHPRLRLAVDHLALPADRVGPDAFEQLPALLALARWPGVSVKASALPCHSAQGYPFADVHEPLRRVLAEFGPRRVFWGSDWTRLPCPYQQNVELFTHALDFLSDADRRQVMGEAILDWLGWNPPSARAAVREGRR